MLSYVADPYSVLDPHMWDGYNRSEYPKEEWFTDPNPNQEFNWLDMYVCSDDCSEEDFNTFILCLDDIQSNSTIGNNEKPPLQRCLQGLTANWEALAYGPI